MDSTADAPDLDANDGLCRTAQDTCSLRAAIQQANATPGYDTVLVPEGSYQLDLLGSSGEDAAAKGDLDIREPLALIGTAPAGSSMGVQISNRILTFGSQYDRIVDIDTGDAQTPVRIAHVAINFGSTDEALGGAGILLRAGSALRLDDVVLYANFGASRGTAMAVYGDAVLRDTRAFDNHPYAPVTAPNVIGTIYVAGNGTLDGDNVAIDSNTAEIGGAFAAVDQAVVTLRRASLNNDAVDNRGGGNAESGLGGGIYLAGQAQATVENSTLMDLYGFTEDEVSNSVYVRDDAVLTLRHASLRMLALQTAGSGSAAIHLADSLLYANAGADQVCGGTLVSEGGNWLTSTAQCALTPTAQDHVVAALQAKDVELYTPIAGGSGFSMFGMPHGVLVPLDGSALDQAPTSSCPQNDQLGATRPAPSASGRPRACDAGALELPLDHLFVDGMDDPAGSS